MSNSLNDLNSYKKDIERQFPVKIDLHLSNRIAFTGEGGEIAVLAFTFGAITGGFLSEIGKDLWVKSKQLCKRIYDKHKKLKDDSKSVIFVELEYKNYQIVAILEADKKIRNKLEALYEGDPLDYFWQGLPLQLETIMKIIDGEGSNINIKNTHALELTLDAERPTWVLSKTLRKIDIIKYIK